MLAKDHHRTPNPHEAPEQHYAALHRALDRGPGNDEIWTELTRICVKIGNNNEAIQAARCIKDPSARAFIQRWLASKGLEDRRPRTIEKDWDEFEKLLQPSFKEELSGAFRFLLEDHMPLTVMFTALTFPLVVGLGGFLTHGSSSLLLPAIAVVPVLSVIALVCALSRRIMVEAAAGMEEPPPIPELGSLVQHASRFLLDVLVIATVLLGPGIACLYQGMPGRVTGAVLTLGIILLPMALVLRQVRNDWRALWPPTLLGAVAYGGMPYVGSLIVGILLFVPAVAVGIATLGSELYLQLSFAGPLVAMPLLVASRFMGRVLSHRSEGLKRILVDQRTIKAESGIRMAPSSARHRRTPESSAPSSRRHGSATRRASQAAPPSGTRRRQHVRRPRPRLDAPLHPETAGVQGTKAAPSRDRSPSAPATPDESCRLFYKVSLDGEDESIGNEAPDVSMMPGATLFKGDERVAAGAAVTKVPAQEEQQDD
ncbi:MAG: hypothetical protein ACYTGO_08320 [Planctomycetota bacterium]